MTIEENISKLTETAKFAGLGTIHEPVIRENIVNGLPAFQSRYEHTYDGDITLSMLNIEKKASDYYLNNYLFQILSRQNDPVAGALQKVYIDSYNRANNITSREMYNLMLGGSVHQKRVKWVDVGNGQKERQYSETWVKLNLKQKDDRGNFKKMFFDYDIDKDIRNQNILGTEDYLKTLAGILKKGNIVEVTVADGQTQLQKWVAADAEFKTMRFYDENPRLITSQKVQSQDISTGQSISSVTQSTNVSVEKPYGDTQKSVTQKVDTTIKQGNKQVARKKELRVRRSKAL